MKIAVSMDKMVLAVLSAKVDAMFGYPNKRGTMRYALVQQRPSDGLYGYCADDSRVRDLAAIAGVQIIDWDESWEPTTP